MTMRTTITTYYQKQEANHFAIMKKCVEKTQNILDEEYNSTLQKHKNEDLADKFLQQKAVALVQDFTDMAANATGHEKAVLGAGLQYYVESYFAEQNKNKTSSTLKTLLVAAASIAGTYGAMKFVNTRQDNKAPTTQTSSVLKVPAISR